MERKNGHGLRKLFFSTLYIAFAAAFVGIRITGIGGAVIATVGCILPSCFIVSLLAFVYYRYQRLSAVQTCSRACVRRW